MITEVNANEHGQHSLPEVIDSVLRRGPARHGMFSTRESRINKWADLGGRLERHNSVNGKRPCGGRR